MLSGALLRIPDDLEIERLNGDTWKREENNETLTSVIQFQERPIFVDSDTTVETALAIHQEITIEPTLVRENGRYEIVYNDTVKTKWAHIYVCPGHVVVDRLGNRGFVGQIFNRGTVNLSARAYNVYLDTARIARDHANQWVRGFSERRGRVDRGTVYGEGVEQDSVFGPELDRSEKKSIGWATNFFGTPVKVRVSPSGSIVVLANPPEGLFLRFLKMQIFPYIIAQP